MKALLKDTESNVDAFIAPGHVTTIIGLDAYEFLAKDFGCPVVVSGFEPLDLLQAILLILQQANEGTASVENQYRRAVTREGNRVAQAAMEEVFEVREALWRGLGFIPGTGLGIAEAYAEWDAERAFGLVPPESAPDPPGCKCGEVLRGIVAPPDCPLFGSTCTPANPVGPCMVSPEGACAAHYKYHWLERS
jgi:hydrogenase expression/formation protein HypD